MLYYTILYDYTSMLRYVILCYVIAYITIMIIVTILCRTGAKKKRRKKEMKNEKKETMPNWGDLRQAADTAPLSSTAL